MTATEPVIRFGPWSTTLGMAAGFGLLIVLLLLGARDNRVANRLLAALILVATLRLMPYVIGYAGFYDAYPWLTFAPFDLGLATGPLLYLYVRRLVTPNLPKGWVWHFAPAAIDLAYTSWAFSLPLADKYAWNDEVHLHWIEPIEAFGALFSLAVYLVLAIRWHRAYKRWLAEQVSDQDIHRQPWIATVLAALALWLAIGLGFEIVDRFIQDLTYFDRYPSYLGFAAIVAWLGLEGWRHARHRFPSFVPVPSAPPPIAPEPAPSAPDEPPSPERTRDWSAQAAQWLARIEREGWWREPGLTLDDVARRLGTNTNYVSRALNTGEGRNFNHAINALRVAAVQAALTAGDPRALLAIALDAGFSSKASFNRVFLLHTGMTPSAWRASQDRKTSDDSAI